MENFGNSGNTNGRDEANVAHLFGRLRGPAQDVRGGDSISLRDHLVMLHTPLVEHCARNFTASGEPLEDLLQEGYVGLIKAVDRFDPVKGVRFSTYACHLISGEIRHYLRDLGKMIHEPGWHSELRQRIARTSDQLTQQLGRTPRAEDIAEALNVRAATVRDVLKNSQTLSVDSLDAERNDHEENDLGARSGSSSAPRALAPQVEDRVLLGEALPQLRDLEKRAIQMFFFEERSKTEVAAELGISVNYAAYLIKQGTQHLREIIEDPQFEEDVTSPAQARTIYLLSLLQKRSKSEDGDAKTAKKRKNPLARPAARETLKDLSGFVAVIDDEVMRAARYHLETSLVWLQVSNWARLSARWTAQESAQSIAHLAHVARETLRSGDRLLPLSPGLWTDLNFVIVLPHTGETGNLVQERLEQALSGDFAADAPPRLLKAKLNVQSAIAILPEHGPNTDALFAHIGSQLSL